MARNVYKMNIIAAGLSVYDKDALVKHVAENHATVAPWLMQLHEAAKDARCIADTIEAAELRLAVALAVVEGDG